MNIRTVAVVICVLIIAILFVVALAMFTTGNHYLGVISLASAGLAAFIGGVISMN